LKGNLRSLLKKELSIEVEYNFFIIDFFVLLSLLGFGIHNRGFFCVDSLWGLILILCPVKIVSAFERVAIQHGSINKAIMKILAEKQAFFFIILFPVYPGSILTIHLSNNLLFFYVEQVINRLIFIHKGFMFLTIYNLIGRYTGNFFKGSN